MSGFPFCDETAELGPEAGLPRDSVAPGSGPFCEPSTPSILGSITDIASNVDPEALLKQKSEAEKDRVLVEASRLKCLAYRARDHARKLIYGHDLKARMVTCGAALQRHQVYVGIWSRPDAAVGRVTGLCLCGQSICCPICGPRVAAKRVAEIQEAAATAQAFDLRLHMATFTMPHKAGTTLHEEIAAWKTAWRLTNGGRDAAHHRWCRLGYINGAEVTWSERNGWHFHRHLLYFTRGYIDETGLRDNWRKSAVAVSRYGKGWEEHALRFDEIDASASKYIAKVGLELAWSASKDSLSPLALLIADLEDPGVHGVNFVEAYHALSTAKVGAVRWSPGLRGKMGLAVEKTDDQLAAESAELGDLFLGNLDATQWALVVHYGREYDLVKAAQQGTGAINQLLARLDAGEILTPAASRPTFAGKLPGQQNLEIYAPDQPEIHPLSRAYCSLQLPEENGRRGLGL
jgi:hypothetical protein